MSLLDLRTEKGQSQKDSPEKVAESAKQFESLLIAQMLRQMRESSGGGWMGTGDDQAGMRMTEVAEEQFAQALSSQGGLGLAHMIEDSLQKSGSSAKNRSIGPVLKPGQ